MHADEPQKKTFKQKAAHEFEEVAILTGYLAFLGSQRQKLTNANQKPSIQSDL